jgi:hypothetical protein
VWDHHHGLVCDELAAVAPFKKRLILSWKKRGE